MKFMPHRNEGQVFGSGERYGWIGLLAGALTALPISLALVYFFNSFVFFGLPVFFGIIGCFVRRVVLSEESASKQVDNVIW